MQRHLAWLALGLAACGHFAHPGDPTDTAAPGGHALTDLLDHSVNAASATVDATPDGLGLVLQTEEGAALVGGFHGLGTGNKSIAGVPGFDGLWVSDLDEITFEMKHLAGPWEPYLNVQVDLHCDGSELKILVVESPEAIDAGDGWSRRTVTPGHALWRAVGGLGDHLAGHLEPEGATLEAMLDAYPHACLIDADTGDGGMPVDRVTSSVLLIVGDSNNDTESEVLVRAVRVNHALFD
ncbi:MAG: hypothetical protein ACI9K2_005825 [Myxococcota bacterium]|jgi:hypothetical protein